MCWLSRRQPFSSKTKSVLGTNFARRGENRHLPSSPCIPDFVIWAVNLRSSFLHVNLYIVVHWSIILVHCSCIQCKHHFPCPNLVPIPCAPRISGSDDRTVRSWHVQTSECCSVLEGHFGSVTQWSSRLTVGWWLRDQTIAPCGRGTCRQASVALYSKATPSW